jgi:phosphoribosyl-ATP pyrophosphohydrolase/phosphoribosyl-AMP cyclohydrolase
MINNIDFEKTGGLIPVIIQDEDSLQVLMLGYMNQEAFIKTQEEGRVCFFSRSKNRLWVKGETSGNYLNVRKMVLDCDQDTLLIQVQPQGPVCHKGTQSCFGTEESKNFIYSLERILRERVSEQAEHSYTYSLFRQGMAKIAQKVGEEAVELVIEAMRDETEKFKGEAADLLFHYLLLLNAKNIRLEDIEDVLIQRHQKSHSSEK